MGHRSRNSRLRMGFELSSHYIQADSQRYATIYRQVCLMEVQFWESGPSEAVKIVRSNLYLEGRLTCNVTFLSLLSAKKSATRPEPPFLIGRVTINPKATCARIREKAAGQRHAGAI